MAFGSGSSLLNTAPGMAAVGGFPKHLSVRTVAVPCTLQFLWKGLGFAERGFDQVPAGVRNVKRSWGPWMLGCCGSGDGGASPEASKHGTMVVLLLCQRGWGWQAHGVLDRAKVHLTSDTSATGFFRCCFCSLTNELAWIGGFLIKIVQLRNKVSNI